MSEPIDIKTKKIIPLETIQGFDKSLVLENIEQNIKDEYLGHLSDSWLQGLTVNKMLDWTIGDILCFDSLSLHCSSNFKSKKIDRKIGLSIFLDLGITPFKSLSKVTGKYKIVIFNFLIILYRKR